MARGIRGKDEMNSRVVLLSCVLMLASIPVVPQEDSPPLPKHFARCTATKKFVCVDGECKEAAPTVFFLLGSEGDKKTYSRCDQQGCETYDAITKDAGLYENWQLAEPQGIIFKRTLSDDQSFLEVATLGLQVYVSFGQCETVSLRPSSLSSSRIGPLSSTVGCQPLPTR